ncbi:glucuronate isomerase [Mucilaginibacter sp. JRF]|uniref:glucuronate isomerase n=1 Tax=Mucilaginibacter sp. JRF TaxID=2780088 RepID=UPI0018809B0A|nr:glucuronate isomerase [Mucilaginibacter sp. JRF]MBE9583690.1 glucuronate isomerase [Mucilaginibacter sp. JRF]
MQSFLNENFLLTNDTARKLYYDYAAHQPIIDYHCHLPPDEIAQNKVFSNLTDVWLKGDHYKWRAMRTNGVTEDYVTGKRGDYEKFEKWAATIPYTLRNPLYHWSHLELQRYFGISEILSPATAKGIYDECTAMLQQPEFSTRSLITRMNVEVICTTDDPIDSLEHHKKLSDDGFTTKVYPTFRPDEAMNTGNLVTLNTYINKLEAITNIDISTYSDYLTALKTRHDYFAAHGCKLSDHGLEHLYADDYTDEDIEDIFDKIRTGKPVSPHEADQFRSALLFEVARWNHEKGWAQQFHIGAIRNLNSKSMETLGPNTGWDAIGDFSHARSLARFLDKLNSANALAKTIVYNLNPADNEMIAAVLGCFNDGEILGKMQFGSAWWFLDQKDGITRQLNSLSNIGLISRMVGMLTDSRSFLSYPRHEYFRRILCNLFAEDIENGELPADIEWTGQIINDICYHNARNYFNFAY